MNALGTLLLLVVSGLCILGAALAVFDRHVELTRWLGQSVVLSAALVAFALTLGRWRLVPLARRTRARAKRAARERRSARRAPAARPQGGWQGDNATPAPPTAPPADGPPSLGGPPPLA